MQKKVARTGRAALPKPSPITLGYGSFDQFVGSKVLPDSADVIDSVSAPRSREPSGVCEQADPLVGFNSGNFFAQMSHKNMNYALIAPFALVLSAPSFAAECMTSVTSEVYQVNGTPREIAARAMTCMSRHLAPRTVDADLILSSDLDGGIIVARSALEYGSLPRWKIRSRFTFEGRDGRFRIEQTNLERFNDQFNVGWGPIGTWPGSQWKTAEQAFVESASVVAQCVVSGPKRANW